VLVLFKDYEDNVKKIPTACITVEDAEMMQRMQERGNIHIVINEHISCQQMLK
jgi:hypothetical protein